MFWIDATAHIATVHYIHAARNFAFEDSIRNAMSFYSFALYLSDDPVAKIIDVSHEQPAASIRFWHMHFNQACTQRCDNFFACAFLALVNSFRHLHAPMRERELARRRGCPVKTFYVWSGDTDEKIRVIRLRQKVFNPDRYLM